MGLVLFQIVLKPTYADPNDPQQNSQSFIKHANHYLKKGDVKNAIPVLEKAIKILDHKQNDYWDALFMIANSYQFIGSHDKAITLFKSVLPVAENSASPDQKGKFFCCLGDIYLSIGDSTTAQKYLEKGLSIAKSSNNLYLQACILNNMGNTYVFNRQQPGWYRKANKAYQQSTTILNKTNNRFELKSDVAINILILNSQNIESNKIHQLIDTAYQKTQPLPDNIHKAENFLSICYVSIKHLNTNDSSESSNDAKNVLIRQTYEMIKQALTIATHLENNRVIAEANGYMGLLYAIEKRYDEAMQFIRMAIFFSDLIHRDDILYYWQWQLGRLFNIKGDTQSAITLFNQAIKTLNPIQFKLLTGYRNSANVFDDKIKPVYLDLAKIYIEQADKANQSNIQQKKLNLAWDTMEKLKSAEMQNYFQDECITQFDNAILGIPEIPLKTAIIYPILFDDHPVILLNLPFGLKQVALSIDSKTITKRVLRFSKALYEWDTYEEDAMFLYQSLFQPVEKILEAQHIDTLIVAADGLLRLIPFTALYDGSNFLTEKFAVVTIPSKNLTNTQSVILFQDKILLGGSSKGRTEKNVIYSPLPYVIRELDSIQKIIGGRTIIDDDFNKKNLLNEFDKDSFSIVHFATHGEFGLTPEQTFIMTTDDIINLNEIQQIFDRYKYTNPVELLTLSSCKTAIGNERAAFGIAGIAVKAGVKSVIASLWPVDDKVACKLLSDFYKNYSLKGTSKAKALQQAQMEILKYPQYYHPSYWASFLLIGNWL